MLRSTRSALSGKPLKVLGDEKTADRASGFGPDMTESEWSLAPGPYGNSGTGSAEQG